MIEGDVKEPTIHTVISRQAEKLPILANNYDLSTKFIVTGTFLGVAECHANVIRAFTRRKYAPKQTDPVYVRNGSNPEAAAQPGTGTLASPPICSIAIVFVLAPPKKKSERDGGPLRPFLPARRYHYIRELLDMKGIFYGFNPENCIVTR